MITAIVYVPSDSPDLDFHVHQCHDYVTHRGYLYAGFYAYWSEVALVLDKGIAQIVVLATRQHWNPQWRVRAEFVEDGPARRSGERYRGYAAPFDESPTVAILDRWREMVRSRNDRPTPGFPRGDDGGFAERFLSGRRRSRHTSDT